MLPTPLCAAVCRLSPLMSSFDFISPLPDELALDVAPGAKPVGAGLINPEDDLPAAITARHGERLPRAAERLLTRARGIWLGRHRVVDRSLLCAIFERAIFYGLGEVELWPDDLVPQNAAEFLACLDNLVQDSYAALPAPLPALADPVFRRRLREHRERLQRIRTWQNRLAEWRNAELSDETAPAPDLRLLLHSRGANVQIRHPGSGDFVKCPQKILKELLPSPYSHSEKAAPALSAGSRIVLAACDDHPVRVSLDSFSEKLATALASLIQAPELLQQHVAGADGEPLEMMEESLRWDLKTPANPADDYILDLVTPEGLPVPEAVCVAPGQPAHYVTPYQIHTLDHWPFTGVSPALPLRIPAPALETSDGVNVLAALGLPPPPRLASRVRVARPKVLARAGVHRYGESATEYLHVRANATFADKLEAAREWDGQRWRITRHAPAEGIDRLIQVDNTPLSATSAWLRQLPLKAVFDGRHHMLEMRLAGKDWPDTLLSWIDRSPRDIEIELDSELAALRQGLVAGRVRLDIEESAPGMDWFDVKLSLAVSDHTLTPEESALLLKARGKWVRLPGKGWRKLDFQLSEEQERDLASMGVSPRQIDGESQRLHAVQMATLARPGSTFLDDERARRLRVRLDEISTRVTPPLPPAITATLRPYQMEGFHFLAYLATNQFGGVLADDMGLGKTLQALSWISWLRAERGVAQPVLVVCPKSVQDNWRAEAARFYPSLRVAQWSRRDAGQTGLDGAADLVVIHYSQLRQHDQILRAVKWGAVILDEAQAIKNPTSQNARAACGLAAHHRLALTGTPVENRLMDLWSIFAFAMPGVLGTRASFSRDFDGKEDPLARRRLAARTRPFLLRRTKNEVATDLPDRVEEDLFIEMEGRQAALYQAELKRARARLLKAQLGGELDKLRFNILTSLLRLRQICCHPRLVGLDSEATPPPATEAPVTAAKKTRGRKRATTAETGDNSPAEAAESAKVAALTDLLEPLMEEGQKVLVFSQFVEMLQILRDVTDRAGWRSFLLTGQTEERGALVSEFQEAEGGAVFLISLKAGGFGLNLTAASYVVLFDPWWNPAVEAQAIDRTHRIGQKQTVFAYRLLVKDSIEEKIRQLQRQKGALARDILGEENFAQALTLQDFQFLLGEG
jgi:hypothetical protein